MTCVFTSRACVICCSDCCLSSTSPFTSSPSSSSLWSSCCSCCPTPSPSLMSWINTLRTSAEDLGTLAQNEPPTGYEANDHFITEAYVEYTQESSGEQRFPDDFDYDDVTTGKTLFDACRRQADHSEEEGLSSCLSSLVNHDNTVKPVLCRLVSSAQTHRQNSENEQIRTLLERQREQILADCQAEIRKHEFQADYDRRSFQKLHETIESQKEEICRAQANERRRQDHQLLHEQLKQNCDLREAHDKSLNEIEELKRFQGSTFDTIARRKLIGRRSRYYPWTRWQDTGTAELNQVYDWFERFARCWISTQWTIPRYQSTSVILPSSNSWRNAKPVYRNAEPQRRAARHLGYTWFIGKLFVNPKASSPAPYPQESNRGNQKIPETSVVFWHYGRVLPLQWVLYVCQLWDRTCCKSCIIHFPTTPPCSIRVDVLETGYVPIYPPFLRWRIWIRLLNWIQKETNLHVQLFGLVLLSSRVHHDGTLCWT